MICNRYGKIVWQEWKHLTNSFSNVTLDEFIVMPNHFHAILIFHSHEDMTTAFPHERKFGSSQAGSLSVAMGQLKSRITKHINADRNAHGLSPVNVWQKRFYDRVIRDEKKLNAIRRYIIENPIHWEKDSEHP